MKLIDEVRGTKVERDRICAERTMSTLAWNCPRGKSFGVQHSTKIVPKIFDIFGWRKGVRPCPRDNSCNDREDLICMDFIYISIKCKPILRPITDVVKRFSDL